MKEKSSNKDKSIGLEKSHPKEKSINFEFRGTESTLKAELIGYCHEHPEGGKAAILEATYACYIPLVLEVNDKNRAMALQYITKCEAFARAGRERWGFVESGAGVFSMPPPSQVVALGNGKLSGPHPSDLDGLPTGDDDDEEEDMELEQSRKDIDDMFG